MNGKKMTRILAMVLESDYKYDPEHKDKPHDGGDWHRTEKGWSDVEKPSYRDVSQKVKDPKTSSEELEKIYKNSPDMGFETRSAMAGNPNTPSSVLEELDGNREIRESVAKHPNTPLKRLDMLSKSPDWHVRLAVAENRNISDKILERLLNDKMYVIRERAKKNKA